MIKVSKVDEPDVLKANKAQWTKDLMALIVKYGSYRDIPQQEKSFAVKNYSHPDISLALKGVHAKAKCVYCEAYVDVTGYATIEHFHPKSLYPNETFEWDNLFVGCSVCNTPKNSFDTGKEPFIHPIIDDPEDYLTFDNLQYVPKHAAGIAYQKAQNVIENCKLQRLALVREHAELLITFLKTRDSLVNKIKNYNEHTRAQKKLEDAAEIFSSLDELNKEAADDAQYAGFIRYLLRKYDAIKQAVAIINAHKVDLGLPDGFIWSFEF